MKLVASMIVHNELGRYLPLSISHLLSFCDEVRVLDDGSDDGTYEYLAEISRVIVKRNPGPSFFEHEGRARNHLLDWTLEAEPDYVLSIDADEFVGDPEIVLRSCRRGGSAYTLRMEEVWRADEVHLHIRVDNLWRPRPCPILWRAPKGKSGEVWKIPDVQLACGREPLVVRRTRAPVSGTSVFHFGWAKRVEREARAQRYFEHDQGRFHKDTHLQSILWPDERVSTQTQYWPQGLSAVKHEIAELVRG